MTEKPVVKSISAVYHCVVCGKDIKEEISQTQVDEFDATEFPENWVRMSLTPTKTDEEPESEVVGVCSVCCAEMYTQFCDKMYELHKQFDSKPGLTDYVFGYLVSEFGGDFHDSE